MPSARLAVVLLAAIFLAAAGPPRLEVDPVWPQPLPHGWVLGEVSGVATDARDHVWIIQRPRTVRAGGKPAPPVIEFDPDGRVVQAWGGPGPGYDWFTSEHGINIDPNGFVWLGGNGAAGRPDFEIHPRRKVRAADRPPRRPC